MATTNETTTKRKYTRRSKEEIEAEKQAKEARKAAREASKLEKATEVSFTPSESETVEQPSEKKSKSTSKKKSSNGQKPTLPAKRGGWSSPQSILTEKLYVEIELLEPALGTSPSDKELLATYIASNAPDAASKEEEIAALGESDMEKKQTTIFMNGWFRMSENNEHFIDVLDRRDGGNLKVNEEADIRRPYFWNYQIRGFFKDSCGLLGRAQYGESAAMTAFKKVIDGGVFVHPRRIAIEMPEFYYDEDGNLVDIVDPNKLPILQRPLRISGPTGERTAIASSEMIPAGSRMKFMIEYTDPRNKNAIIEWLNYGSVHGLGAWRNSGRGAFIWRELNPDWSPIIDEEE